MDSSHKPLRLSLRGRCVLYTGALLVLFVVSVSNAVNTLHHAMTMMESNLEENVEELAPILALEKLIYQTERTLYVYMASPQPEGATQFMKLGKEMDNAFDRALRAPFGVAEERRAVSLAHSEWQEGRVLVHSLATTDTPAGHLDSVVVSELRARLDRMVEALERMRLVAQSELKERVASTERAVDQAHWETVIIMASSGGLAFIIGLTLMQSVFGRLDRLEEGTERLAGGDLSTRVDVQGTDELGRFGETFNVMAERLQQAHAELKRQATRDGLTGLHNHVEFQRLLLDEVSRSRRYHHPLSLMLLDVDHFKEVNDTFGHPSGDDVLRHLAKVLEEQCRPADHIARYGGEEFTVILPEIEHAGAMASAERIRRAVAEQSVPLINGKKAIITVSIGVATFPNHADSAEVLIKRADTAMYLAKQAGRNLCISAGIEL